MDVDQDSFRKVLLDILINIVNADYVILDLEMSGINGRQPGTRHSAGKPSLQDLYEEIRAAAEIFQILQLGITCVGSDVEKGKRLPFRTPGLFHAFSCTSRCFDPFNLGIVHQELSSLMFFFSALPF